MGRQKFCSCPIFFDEPFTWFDRERGSPPRASYLYVKCIFMRGISRAIIRLSALIATDFLGFLLFVSQKQK